MSAVGASWNRWRVSMFSGIFLILVIFNVIHESNAQNNRRASQSCQTPSGQTGNCVDLPNCPDLNALFQRRPIPDDVKELLRSSSCGFEGNTPKVCCAPAELTSRNAAEDRGPIPRNSLIPTLDECGDNLVSKIIGGEDTELREFPWMALLEYTKPNGKGFHCGGVLVAARYVLTAAHCVNGPNITPNIRLTSVRLGEWDTSTARDCSPPGSNTCSEPPVDIPIESSVVHEGYDRSGRAQANDIALLRLARPVRYTLWIRPICLPLISDQVSRKSYVGEDGTVAGWGRTSNDGGYQSTKLQKINLPVVATERCNSRYNILGVRLSALQMCAGGRSNKDSCQGDSGGPFMVQHEEGANSNWYVTGIVSLGPTPCGTPGWPGVYTDVTKYGAWISRNIKP